MLHVLDDMVLFITCQEIESMVRSLARQIEFDYQGREVVLIVPLSGSIHFVTDLCRELSLPQQIDFVQVKSLNPGGMITITKDLSMDVRDRHILIVEEIVDNGRTLSFLRQHILSSEPASLKIVTLLDKPSHREHPIHLDYVGRVIDDRYVVGYGMDRDELGRNLPDIYSLKN